MEQHNGNYWTNADGKQVAWSQNWFDGLFECNREEYADAMRDRITLKNDPDAVTHNYGGRIHAEPERLDKYYKIDEIELDELEQALDEIETCELCDW